MKEIWRDIKGYEGLYQVSNLGKVKNSRTGELLKLSSGTHGYLMVCLTKNGKQTTFRVHRLVAEAFIPNPDNLQTIDHINRIRTDNRVENLRWADMKLQSKNRDNKNRETLMKVCSKPVHQYTLDMEFIIEYPSVREAARQLNINYRNISLCCLGKRKSAGGYIWRYVTKNPLQ